MDFRSFLLRRLSILPSESIKFHLHEPRNILKLLKRCVCDLENSVACLFSSSISASGWGWFDFSRASCAKSTLCNVSGVSLPSTKGNSVFNSLYYQACCSSLTWMSPAPDTFSSRLSKCQRPPYRISCVHFGRLWRCTMAQFCLVHRCQEEIIAENGSGWRGHFRKKSQAIWRTG